MMLFSKTRKEISALRLEVFQLRQLLQAGFQEFGIVLENYQGRAVSAVGNKVTVHEKTEVEHD